MTDVLIVGAGQSGLQLALGLQAAGVDVTLLTARGAQEIRDGRVMSTQCMFGHALGLERRIGADLWGDSGHRIDGLGVSVAGPDGPRVIDWLGRLEEYAQSVDQRVKMAAWLELFEQRGGNVELASATVADLDRRAAQYDLTIVAAGKGEISALFERDPERSPYAEPQRSLAIAYVHGAGPRPEHPDVTAVRLDLVPGVGELIVVPALTTSGPCDILFWEGIPGGPIDVFDELRDQPQVHLERTLELMRQYTPWEYERFAGVELTDANGTLSGRFAPVVRQPVATLPGGAAVLGMADVIVANDPITGQGSNNAERAADLYLGAVLERLASGGAFDGAWMRSVGDAYWRQVAVCTGWTNAMLAPPPPHVLEVLGAAGEFQAVADRFANGFSQPDSYADWMLDPQATAAYLAEVAQA